MRPEVARTSCDYTVRRGGCRTQHWLVNVLVCNRFEYSSSLLHGTDGTRRIHADLRVTGADTLAGIVPVDLGEGNLGTAIDCYSCEVVGGVLKFDLAT